jgi:3-phenylpropionate/trans-cinnamate dioxygenase ferredoxin reductase subunit
VVVDEGARTIVPGVYAAGDVVRGCHHWETAARLGAAAARSILGVEPVVPPVESFWSDQYGLRIHLVGSAAGADAVEIDRSSERCFTAALSRHGSLIGALLVDRPRELPSWRRRLAGASTLETRSAA